MNYNNKFQRAPEELKKVESDSDSEQDESEIFNSALEVGSTFIKILPDEEELLFKKSYQEQGSKKATLYLENITRKADLAYIVREHPINSNLGLDILETVHYLAC